MNAKPLTENTGIMTRRIDTVFMAIALLLMSACSTLTSTNEVAEAQLKASKELGVPVEKMMPKSGVVLRLIPAGIFEMGSPKSEQDAVVESASSHDCETMREWVAQQPQHKVTLTKPFYMGKYEVTHGQWEKVMGSNPLWFMKGGDNEPVKNVSWHDCTNFMKKLEMLEGMPEGSCRLPTEAQWEYACRAGTETAFCYGNDLDASMANFNGGAPFGKGKKGEYREKIMAVGSFKPNAWGVYDMHGNVWEWCADWYGEYEGDATDPRGPESGSNRVMRGGSWRSQASDCRSANRLGSPPSGIWDLIGFRLSLPAGQP